MGAACARPTSRPANGAGRWTGIGSETAASGHAAVTLKLKRVQTGSRSNEISLTTVDSIAAQRVVRDSLRGAALVGMGPRFAETLKTDVGLIDALTAQ